jgi:hypothetical protein
MNNRRLLTILIVLALFFGWRCGYESFAPNELVGVWTTSDPKYADRFLKIDRDAITFGTGEGNFETYAITKMKKGAEVQDMLYTIYYEDEAGDTYTLAMYYSPERGGVLRLKNQREIIWTKE